MLPNCAVCNTNSVTNNQLINHRTNKTWTHTRTTKTLGRTRNRAHATNTRAGYETLFARDIPTRIITLFIFVGDYLRDLCNKGTPSLSI